ncbi:MAG: DUF4838 domain-containing protein [Acidobacteriota bacterium]|nr:DUF4838 domain-containing protein [Acidobacteriota bacterium]
MHSPRLTKSRNFLTSFALLGAAAAIPLRADVTIARGGRAEARIVVAADATETERFAASELALFLHLVTGADFVVGTESGNAAGSRLFVGEGAARAADPGFPADLAAEEIFVAAKGSDVFLAGGSPRGTLYAVYTFLEDTVGCRWWTKTASTLPSKPTLRLGGFVMRSRPAFEYREPYWYEAFDPVWAARNKANGIQAGGGDREGGRQVYQGFVHTFYTLIPPDKYFADHPEWFSEIGGKRTGQDAQLCLTNEEMRRELVANLRLLLRQNPKATIASVSQNDCAGYCTCPACRAVDAEEGGPAGSLLRFVNAVAADLEGEFPNVAFDTLAYQYSRKPPRLVRPRPNVIVRLCSIECSFARPLDDPRNKAFFEDLEGWAKIAGRLYIWDYTTNFSHYVQPHPNYSVLAPNLRLFASHNVQGVFEQGAYQSWASEMAELRSWVLAKLLWNPNLDPARLRREFLDGYYGPAADKVEAYLTLMEKALARSGDALGCYSPAEAKFLSLDVLRKGWSILESAERKARLDEYCRRVRIARLPVAYVVLARWDELKKSAGSGWPWGHDRAVLLDWFLKETRASGATHISEWQSLDDWAVKGGQRK